MEIGTKVRPSVSVRAGQVGTVVCLGQNTALPVAVVFDDNIEWDFKESELEVLKPISSEFNDEPFDEDVEAVAEDIEKRQAEEKRVKVGSIDLEPTWAQLLNMAKREVIPVEELEKACILADTVRQAQKRGESITIYPDGRVTVDDGKKDVPNGEVQDAYIRWKDGARQHSWTGRPIGNHQVIMTHKSGTAKVISTVTRKVEDYDVEEVSL